MDSQLYRVWLTWPHRQDRNYLCSCLVYEAFWEDTGFRTPLGVPQLVPLCENAMISLYISREFKPLGFTRKRLLALLRWHREHAICWQLLLQIYSKCFPALHQIVCCKENSGKVRAILHSALALPPSTEAPNAVEGVEWSGEGKLGRGWT